MSMVKTTRKWREMASYYRRFAEPWKHLCDFSEISAEEMFVYESRGTGSLGLGIFNGTDRKLNGYLVGKHWMDVTVSMWKKDIESGFLFVNELIMDGYDVGFLKRVGIIGTDSVYYELYVALRKIKRDSVRMVDADKT